MRTRPRVIVVLPAAESPTTPGMIGLGMLPPSTYIPVRKGEAAWRLPRSRRPIRVAPRSRAQMMSTIALVRAVRFLRVGVGLLLLRVREHRALPDVLVLDRHQVF